MFLITGFKKKTLFKLRRITQLQRSKLFKDYIANSKKPSTARSTVLLLADVEPAFRKSLQQHFMTFFFYCLFEF